MGRSSMSIVPGAIKALPMLVQETPIANCPSKTAMAVVSAFSEPKFTGNLISPHVNE